MQELAAFYIQLMINFFPPSFTLPFQMLCPPMIIPGSLLSSLSRSSQPSIVPVASTFHIPFLRSGRFLLSLPVPSVAS